ncbi:leucine efflux protein LeuE [Luedemannella helvata]|uniref:Leucine efflux protein LeuE n=2 Tax=Luedemannella helvata TaxID=349315 RepID=A0ABP4WTF9_9ACTN
MGGMLGVTDPLTYLLGTIAIVLLPGPNSMFVLATAARFGVRRGYRAATGVFLGDLVLMTLAAAGVASALRAYPPLFTALKYAGAAYLAYLGLGMARAAVRRWRHGGSASSPGTAAEHAHARDPFRRALLVSLINPKAILFFVSFFIQFVDPSYAYPALTFVVLGAVLQVCSVAYLSALIFGGNVLANHFRERRRLASALSAGVAALFIAFGVKLATASLG